MIELIHSDPQLCLMGPLRNYRLRIGSKWRTYVSVNLANVGSDNGLSPVRPQAIIWTNAGTLSFR